MSSSESPVKVQLPFPATANAKALCSTWTAQSALIKQAPAYATTPSVQTVVTDMDTTVSGLQTTLTRLDTLHAETSSTETTRDTQMAACHLKHDGVVAALNVTSNGDPAAAEAWTGKTQQRSKPVLASASTTDAPLDPTLRVVKRSSGQIRASCKADASAVCYLFQQGTDPVHPETWPTPVMSKGHTYTAKNLPIGQVVCVRIAVVRRGSVQGQWSPVLSVTVR
jgi:hypothetical protein